MNDRYLFKAKRINNGEWVQGYYIYYPYGMGSEVKEDHVIKDTIKGVAYFIDPATLCQCTGLKDKNKKLIWENDIVLTSREDGYSLVCWNDTEARWEMYNETEGIVLDFDNYWADEIEVYENRIDNPELLEVE